MTRSAQKIVALSGGIGGAKLALGLYNTLAADALTVICNIGDDFEHLGLAISPDIDTVVYTLAGVSNREAGWGRDGETWQFMSAWQQLGGDAWFNLGDKDLATHVLRSQRLLQGQTLSDVCAELAAQFDIRARILPVTNDAVPTMVLTQKGPLPFQHYFVRDQCAPIVTGFEYSGVENAQPAGGVLDALLDDNLDAIVVCPSNPFISIDPMLAVPGIRDAFKQASAPVIAVSPIIAGQAIKGPTAKMMAELGLEVSVLTVANHYREFLDGYVVDDADAAIVETLDLPVLSTPTLMRNDADKRTLAERVLSFAATLSTS